jgi:membrane protease YdiL (CAAX protease family)
MTRSVARPFTLLVGIALVVAARWGATLSAPGDGLLVGLAFGAGLVALAMAGGWRLPRLNGHRTASGIGLRVGVGVASGLLLVALAELLWRDQLPVLRPAASFLPWLGVTALVATAEEMALRGALFAAVWGALGDVAGPAAAILVTSAVFALIHVPFYGWQVVPLDLGVGLLFGGLRLASGGVAAPAVAHLIADAATWWM